MALRDITAKKNYAVELVIVNDEFADPVVPSEVITLTLYKPNSAVSGIARVQLTDVEEG
jgi:ribosomal protein S12